MISLTATKQGHIEKAYFGVRSEFDFCDAKHKASKSQSVEISNWKCVMNSDESYRIEVGT